MKIKVCGLKETNNIVAVSDLGVDYIGLIFYPGSKRCIDTTDKALQQIAKNSIEVPKVGVFVNAGYKTILDAVYNYGLHYVQLHGAEGPDCCACLSGHVSVIKAFAIDSAFSFEHLKNYEKHCAFFLFDTVTRQYGGSGTTFDWNLLAKYTLQKQYFLSGGINLSHLAALKSINDNRMLGIDVNSCFETEPGIKNIHKIKALIHELRN